MFPLQRLAAVVRPGDQVAIVSLDTVSPYSRRLADGQRPVVEALQRPGCCFTGHSISTKTKHAAQMATALAATLPRGYT